MTQLATESRVKIDHPVHEDWRAVNLELLDPEHEKRIHDNFSWTDQDPRAIWRAMDAGVHYTVAHRDAQETSNRDRLISRPDHERMMREPFETPPYVPEAIRKYRELAGHNNTLPQYVSWFGGAALAAFGHTDTYGPFGSVSLEIAGIGQAGDWESTGPLDQIIEGLPSRLQDADKSLKVVTFAADVPAQYTFSPLRVDDNDSYSFRFGIERRRRWVANVTRSDTPNDTVRIFKQSVGIVVLGLLPKADRDTIEGAYRTNSSQEARDRVAAIGGAVFERAIRERGALEVVPLSVQYIMKVRRPQA